MKKTNVDLFWVSMGLVLVGTAAAAVYEVVIGEGHHLVYLVPIWALASFCAFLYRQRSFANDSLRDSEGRYRLLMEEASDPIFVTSLSTRRFVAANRRALELAGYSLDELRAKQVPDVVDQTGIDVDSARRELAEGAVLHLEQKIIRKDGLEIPVECGVTLVSDDLVQAIVRPIGKRKLEEEALRRSEAVFRAVSELTSDYAYSMKVEPDGSLKPDWLTGAFERVTGYTVEESQRQGGWQALVHPDDIPAMGEVLAESLRTGGSAEAEFRIIAKSGTVKHLRSWSRFERDEEDGPVVRIVGAVSDITEQKLLEEDLGESERRFSHLYERLPIAIYRRAWPLGPGLDANPTCVEMFGYPDERTYLDQDPADYYVDPDDRVRWVEAIDEVGVVRNFEVRYKRYDGTSFWGRNTARLIRDNNGNAWIEGAIIDITEEKNLDEELRSTLRDLRRADGERRRLLTHLVKAKEAERHRVASDIHDDSVQVMTSIAIDLERLSRKTADRALGSSLAELESRVRDAVGRLRTMVFDLRPPTLDQEGVASALRLYLEEFSIDTGIRYEFTSRLDHEPANPTRVVLYRIAQEALTNVRKHSDASRVAVDLERRDSGIAMRVTDDGIGFDPDSDDIVSPGHIGLSEMRERAEMGGGRFHIHSGPDRGTTIDVWVPELQG